MDYKDAILSVRIDSKLKKEAEKLFKELGLNSSTAINMFFKQAVHDQGIPFEITAKKPNQITKEAFEEGLKIINDPKAKKYDNIDEFFKDLNS